MKRSDFFVEFWALVALIAPVTAAVLFLGLHLAEWQGSRRFAEGIIEHNNAVVVLVQIVSQILGLILVQALCTIVKIHLRSSISEKPVRLEHARLLNAISQTKLLVASRHTYTIVTILIALLAYIPGAIWAGAISPRVVLRTVNRNAEVPLYPDDWAPGGTDRTDYNSVHQNNYGLFTIDPNRFTGLLLDSARQASNRRTLRSKPDDTGYSFMGRSFDAGSNLGLESVPVGLLDYSYN